ncbi:sugar-binding transcriptional regulator [Corynebacterium glucuronolyticum]|uniref:sugar-binding transcriptional regulator n=1 Tax=Corynebacterium glucuronolyticum TaxID=39791 RepID=UPI00223A9BF8|nr:sugar-binding transcriptional regulator [Corynebacterium glucuronolyticum]MCT1443449.1 sugar-binding transcriptional regulator [Corynebacterium glucuronolyticum]
MEIGADRKHVELLLQVARLYYVDNLTQQEIAREIGYSRSTVSRLLEFARESGVVRISIAHPLERQIYLEKAVSKHLPVEFIRVTNSGTENPINSVGKTAAEVLVEMSKNAKVLAVGNGRTVAATASAMPQVHRSDCTVVQMLGSIPGGGRLEFGRDSPTICNQIAHRFGAFSARMSVPLFVASPELQKGLLREERVATTLTLASRADLAIVGVANVDLVPGKANSLTPFLNSEFLEIVRQKGAVGHILDQLYDKDGNEIKTPFSEKTIALSLASLRGIPIRIGVACGQEKTHAIISAINGRLINALITDENTARSILDALKRGF